MMVSDPQERAIRKMMGVVSKLDLISDSSMTSTVLSINSDGTGMMIELEWPR